MAKLMPGIGLRYRVCALRNLIARHKRWPILIKIDAKFFGVFGIEHQTLRVRNRHRRLPGEHLRRQGCVAIVPIGPHHKRAKRWVMRSK